MFTTISTKNTLCNLVGALLVIYSFSILGCSRKLSDRDMREILHQVNMRALERKNAQLTKENEKLRKENKELKGNVASEIEPNKDNTDAVKENEEPKGNVARFRFKSKTNPSPSQKQTPPHTILRVGNKLPHFDFNDVTASNSTIYWTAEKEFYYGREYGPNIRLPEKGAWIELKNGTRYICATQGGCRIDWTNFAIIEGTIEVYHNKNSK